jgi:hypothetical protein
LSESSLPQLSQLWRLGYDIAQTRRTPLTRWIAPDRTAGFLVHPDVVDTEVVGESEVAKVDVLEVVGLDETGQRESLWSMTLIRHRSNARSASQAESLL